MRKFTLQIFSVIFGAVLLVGGSAFAANVYVLDTVQENTASRWGIATTSLVKDAVTSSGDNRLTRNENSADYVLQPKLLGLGDGYVLTVEKRRGDKIVLAKQVRVSSLDDLDKATARVTHDVLLTPNPISSAATAPVDETVTNPLQTSNSLEDWNRGATPVYDYWTFAIGPFGGTNLNTDKLMYSASLGHTWDIHPKVSIDALAEAAFSTGNENARMFNVAVGPAYYFSRGPDGRSPFASLDFGYGVGNTNSGLTGDQNINGFTLGVGAGYRFFRTATTGMELDLRWATLFDPVVNNGNPQIIGARLGVDF